MSCELMFSRASNGDKLTHAFTVKLGEADVRLVSSFASIDNADGASDWIRHLILQEIGRRRDLSDRLNAIFGEEVGNHKGNRGCQQQTAPLHSQR